MPLPDDFVERFARPLLDADARFRGARLADMTHRELVAVVGYLCDLIARHRSTDEITTDAPATGP